MKAIIDPRGEFIFDQIALKVFNVMSTQILLVVGTHQIVKNHLVFIHVLDMSLCLQAVLWFGSPSYRQRWHLA